VLVRLPDSLSLEQGRQQLAAILTEMARVQMPRVKTEVAIQLVPVREVRGKPGSDCSSFLQPQRYFF
jgi:hypothetical protein